MDSFNIAELLLGIVVRGGNCTSAGRRRARLAVTFIGELPLGIVVHSQYCRIADWHRWARLAASNADEWLLCSIPTRRATSDFEELLPGIAARGWQFLIGELLPGIVAYGWQFRLDGYFVVLGWRFRLPRSCERLSRLALLLNSLTSGL